MATNEPRGLRAFPAAFWTANAMEIFERMGWYGFYAVSSLYLTGAVEDGGLGFSSGDRGVIQGIATFFLYLFPAVFGALADRYGYKQMFLAACVVMGPGYLLLQLPTTFWGFLAVYMLVAVGHGMFKPVVVSTVARTTTPKTASMGFGIFYMMVNVGGFLGPIVAGVVRGWDWKYVFWCSAAWILAMAVTCAAFYREPAGVDRSGPPKPLSEVLGGMVAVVGNGRFFLLIVGLLQTLVMGSKWWSPTVFMSVALGWVALNLGFDQLVRGNKNPSRWYLQPMRIGEGRYLLFLLLMSGFWTSFNQIFITLPEYIRDYGDTAALVSAFHLDSPALADIALLNGEVKPEFLINLNAWGIIVGQVLISYLMRNVKPLRTIINGVLVTVVSFSMFLAGGSGWVIVAAILVFSVGEMMASPKSKEYAGSIAPPEKVGMYMGYFFWCSALGNLFGGLLSGSLYERFGPTGMNQPGIMWAIFAALSAASAVALVFYDRWVRTNPAQSA